MALSETDDGTLSLVPAQQGSDGLDSKAAHLDILQKDGFLGLRCLEAKGRFLQARRRARHRLCFFSDHWGVWEQWQIVACMLTGDGCSEERELHLSPRQLPNFMWRVHVAPVGYSNAGAHTHHTGQLQPRGMHAHPPADGILDLSMRLTVGFAQRFHRRPLPAAFAVWRQLVQQRRNCMGQLRKSAKRWRQRWLRDAFARWRAGAEATRRRRSLLQRGLQRHATRALAAAFQIWLGIMNRRQQLAVIAGKLAGLHARRTQAATFAAWLIEMRCRRRLAVLADRLKTATAARRLRGSFLAWAGLVLASDLAVAIAAGRGRFIELTPNPLFDLGPRRLELQSPTGRAAPFTFPRAARQRAVPGLAPQPPLAELPANLLQQLDSAAAAAHLTQQQLEGTLAEMPSCDMWRGGCATDARPAAAALRWPFRFGGYLQSDQASTPGAPDQAPRLGAPNQTPAWRAPNLAPTPASSNQAAMWRPDQTPALAGRPAREATPFYTPAADILCFFPRTFPAATPLGITPEVPSAGHLHHTGPPLASANGEDQEINHRRHAVASPDESVSRASQQPSPEASASAGTEGADISSSEQPPQLPAAGLEEQDSLQEAQQKEEMLAASPESLSKSQAHAASGVACQLRGVLPGPFSPGQDEADIRGVCSNDGQRSVCGPRLKIAAAASGRGGARRESTGSCTPAHAPRRHVGIFASAARSTYPPTPTSAAHPTTDLVAAVQSEAANRLSGAEAASLAVEGWAGMAILEGEQATAAAQPQLEAAPADCEPVAADESVRLGQSAHADESSLEAVTPLQSSLAEPADACRADLEAASAAVAAVCALQRQEGMSLQPPQSSPVAVLPESESLPGTLRSSDVHESAADRGPASGKGAEASNLLVSAAQGRPEGSGAAAEALAEQCAQRLLCLRALTAWLLYVDRRRERWDLLRRAIAFRVQRLQATVLSALSQHARRQLSSRRSDMPPLSAQKPPAATLADLLEPPSKQAGMQGQIQLPLEDRRPLEEASILEEAAKPKEAATPEEAASLEEVALPRGPALSEDAALPQTASFPEQAVLLERPAVSEEAALQEEAAVSEEAALSEEPASPGEADVLSRESWQDVSSLGSPPTKTAVLPPRDSVRCRDNHGSASAVQHADEPQGAAGSSVVEGGNVAELRSAGSEAEVSGRPAWDGEVAAVFRAWQEATVMQWRQRLARAEPLLRRQRWRSLAWPFRAWATVADERNRSAVQLSGTTDASALLDARVAGFCWERSRRLMSDAFWHWQDTTVWEWKRRRDAVALARLRGLGRLLCAWHALITSSPAACASSTELQQCASAAAAASEAQALPSEAAADHPAAALELLAPSLQGTAEQCLEGEAAATTVELSAAEGAALRKRLRRVFGSWRAAAAASQAARSRLAEFQRRQERRCTAAALHDWRSRARMLRSIRRAWAIAAKKRLKAAFAAWRVRAAELAAARGRARLRQTCHALHAWRALMADERRLRAAATAARNLVARRRVALALAALRAAAQRARQQRESALAAAARVRARTAASAFAAWKSAAEAAREDVFAADALAVSAMIGRSVAVLGAWRLAAAAARRAAEAAEQLSQDIGRRVLRDTFSAWHSRAHAERVRREQAAEEHQRVLSAQIAAQAFAGWVEEVEHGQAAVAAADELSERQQARRLRAIFAAWRVANATLANERSAALSCLARAAMASQVIAAFAAWARFARGKAAARDAAAAMLQRRSQRRLRAAYAAWRVANATLSHERSAALEALCEHAAAGRAAAALAAWRSSTAAFKTAAAGAEELRQQSSRRVLRGCFAAWRVANATFEHERTAALECFKAQADDSRLQAALAAWRLAVSRARATAAAARQLDGHIRQREIGAVIAAWREESAEGTLREIAAVGSTRQRSASNVVARAFFAWRQATIRAQQVPAAAEAAAVNLQLRQLRRAFAQWQLFRQCRAHDRAALVEVSAELASEGRLAAVLRAWRAAAAAAAAAEAAAEYMSWLLRRRRVREAFAAWRTDAAAMALDQAAAEDSAAAFAQRKALRRLFDVWCKACADAASARAAAATLRERAADRALLTAFQAWRLESAEGAAQEKSSLAAVAKRLFFFRAAAVVIAWRQLVSERTAREAAAHRLFHRAQASSLCSALRAWQEAAANSRAAVLEAEASFAACQSRRASTVLTAWHMLAFSQPCDRAALLGALLRKAAAIKLRAAFGSWRKLTERLDQAQAAAGAAGAAGERRILASAFQGWRCRAQGARRRRLLRAQANKIVRLARSFYVWAEAVAGRREGDVAAACSAEAAAGAASAALEARINSLEQQRAESGGFVPKQIDRRVRLSVLLQQAVLMQEDLAGDSSAALQHLSANEIMLE
ncbi:hypothetical protein COCSUDRAFT_56596 [Coccomyxa subellipsoidea C-169]|uniref:Sfi1 spindle body domain-containing protein n=1 Tax=Coccomyxa subellipsoidea (strain C-169) TaxID=574566 RepID=I0YSK8_COCSC|nr:hypothetical protein COCSUDRAFT_56596 [Coccomyxa subellipsoidea C-169]EIE21377.1 hypothetical protein COCSUDRAFT_56596 [Coccomyxa subellipsoidea C-169]|eukprot:XP_005645921.1 hypothetical protein COCSUDRAFT_56596 [Coccomyxa subellipsoidea C-169]